MSGKSTGEDVKRVVDESNTYEPIIIADEDGSIYSNEEILNRLLGLNNFIDESYHEMGIWFRTIYCCKLYLDYGYLDWKSFIEDKIGLKIRKANYIMKIADDLAVGTGDDYTIQKIGLSKVQKLVGVIDPTNTYKWIKKCADATVREVSQKVSRFLEKMVAKKVFLDMYGEEPRNDEDEVTMEGVVSGSGVRNNHLSLVVGDNTVGQLDQTITDPVVRMEIQKLEQRLGVRLVALDNLTENILYGQEYFN